jgi:N-acetylglucosaminyl-diphospho-decaprenol L-rhamnosyltransferase
LEVIAIIVDYRSDRVDGLIEKLHKQVDHLVVVDNAASVATVSTAKIGSCVIDRVSYGANLGYGRAVNRALAGIDPGQSPGYVVISNPDVIPEPDTVGELVEILRNDPSVALVGPRIVDRAGNPYPSFRRFPSLMESFVHGFFGSVWPNNRFSLAYRRASEQPRVPIETDWLSGAFLVADIGWLKRVGGFDSSYFMYLEDVDLARRLKLAGGKIIYDPGTSIVHEQGVSASSRPYVTTWYHHSSLLRYGTASQRSDLLVGLIGSGILARFLLKAASTGVKNAVQRGTSLRRNI